MTRPMLDHPSVGAPQIYVRCESTGLPVPTGVRLKAAMLHEMCGSSAPPFRCADCGDEHRWDYAEGFYYP
jgi:hypothetical protein